MKTKSSRVGAMFIDQVGAGAVLFFTTALQPSFYLHLFALQLRFFMQPPNEQKICLVPCAFSCRTPGTESVNLALPFIAHHLLLKAVGVVKCSKFHANKLSAHYGPKICMLLHTLTSMFRQIKDTHLSSSLFLF